jgi:uncharacterized membrane protein/Cu/Ag efflux protein CusF
MMNMEIIPNWHPMLVHFTVALFTVSALLYLAGLILKKPHLFVVGRWNLWIGALATILTVAAGFDAYNSIAHDGPLHAAMTDHKNWALVTAAIFGLLALWAGFKHRGANKISPIFVVIILAASGLLAITGYKGGEVVYRHGGGVMRMPEISGDGGHGSHSHGEGAGHGDMEMPASTDEGGASHHGVETVPHGHGGNSSHNTPQKAELATGTGVINSVDIANRKINISHAPIDSISWPAMTMDLYIAENVDIESLSSNQNIQFYLELGEDKIYRITKIDKPEVSDHDSTPHDH